MVLYYPQGIALHQFGIEIPVVPDRSKLVLDAILADADRASRKGFWLIEPDGTRIGREDLVRVHSEAYVDDALADSAGAERLMLEVFELLDENGEHYRYDPASAERPLAELLDDILVWTAGSVQAGGEALDRGMCYYLGGGAHHGHFDFGHGFCACNDIVVGIRHHQAAGRIRSAWVIDTDAHKGDGTAALTAADPTIHCLSIHMADGWPLDLPSTRVGKPAPWLVPSTVDIPIASGEESHYFDRLEAGLATLAQRSAEAGVTTPDLCYVVSGSDPYEYDELPSTSGLRLSLDQLLERDRLVHRFLKERSIPQAWLLAGGYGKRAWEPFATFVSSLV